MAQTVCVIPSDADLARLSAIVNDRARPLKHLQCAHIILLSAERLAVLEVAQRAGVSRPAVWRWQQRYAEEGVDGLLRDKTRPPGKPPHSTDTVAEVLALTCSEPPGAVTHWTGRAVADTVGISLRSVQRIWDAHRLQPHRVRSFKRSSDPAFAEKVEDIVGLDMDPPRHAVVLSLDETSQIQALERTRPSRAVKPGRPETQTHDDHRHGTTTLFAALNVLEGTVIGRCMQRHRHDEFLRFLNTIEAAVPGGEADPRDPGQLCYPQAPESARLAGAASALDLPLLPDLWLVDNAVEGFFSALTQRRLRRGSFSGIVDLQAAINRSIAEHNDRPKPFVWTKPAAAIFDAVNRNAAPSV